MKAFMAGSTWAGEVGVSGRGTGSDEVGADEPAGGAETFRVTGDMDVPEAGLAKTSVEGRSMDAP